MARFSLYFGTGLTSVFLGHFLSLITRSVPNFAWVYWAIFIAVVLGCIVCCSAVARKIYSGQFATTNSVFLTIVVITLIGYLMGVTFGWGF